MSEWLQGGGHVFSVYDSTLPPSPQLTQHLNNTLLQTKLRPRDHLVLKTLILYRKSKLLGRLQRKTGVSNSMAKQPKTKKTATHEIK